VTPATLTLTAAEAELRDEAPAPRGDLPAPGGEPAATCSCPEFCELDHAN
jgi:hypothetical protein